MKVVLDKEHEIVDFYSDFSEVTSLSTWVEALTYEEAREFAKKLLEMLDDEVRG